MSAPTSVRRRNSADSRERLLKAASELFAERGYERTTVREVGQRAGVDPAMIARYFGGKAALYLASLRYDTAPASVDPIDVGAPAAITLMLDRVGSKRPTPTLWAAVRPHDDSELQSAAMDVLNRRMVYPAEQRAKSSGHADAQLRAQIVTSALAGIVLSRTSGAFPELAAASSAKVGQLVGELLNSLLEQGDTV